VANVQGFDQREDLLPLKGAEIAVSAAGLPRPAEDEFYWSELIGRRVVNTAGIELGVVTQLIETGAHDVLVVGKTSPRLIPFVRQYVVSVSEDRVEVEWPEDWES